MAEEERCGEGAVYIYVLYVFHGEEADNSKENADEVFRCIATLKISIIQNFQWGGGGRDWREYVRFVEK